MADPGTVTIGKAYFEALLRRAEFHTSGEQSSHSLDFISIPKAEHSRLLRAEHEYNNLKVALYNEGFTEDNLRSILAFQGRNASYSADSQNSGALAWNLPFESRPSVAQSNIVSPVSPEKGESIAPDYSRTTTSSRHGYKYHSRSNTGIQYGSGFGGTFTSLGSPKEQDDLFFHDESGDHSNNNPSFPRNGQRSLHLTGLADGTTHKDITSVIRGGVLVDIHVRNDRTATVAFASPSAAAAFFTYAKRKDLYINTKRIQVQWNDRQFYLTPHVSQRIAQGASRNLVIRNGGHKLSEQSIRDDLEHIHNLVVTNVVFKGADIYVSTNSVNNALFARNCMLSRATYKGLRIDHFPDECAAPLPKDVTRDRAPTIPESSKRPSATFVANRFGALAIQDGEDEDNASDMSEEDTNTMPLGFNGVNLNWAKSNAIVT